MEQPLHVKKLEVTQIKMCTWPCDHKLSDHVRNDDIRERLKVENITERWFGDVEARPRIEMVPPGRRKRGRRKQIWMDCVNRDMRAIGTKKDEVHVRTDWRRIVFAAANPQPSASG